MTTETTTETKLQGYAVLDIAELRAMLAIAERKSWENYGCLQWHSTVIVRFALFDDPVYQSGEGEQQVDGRSITVQRKGLDAEAKYYRERMS